MGVIAPLPLTDRKADVIASMSLKPQEAARLMQRATIASVLVALSLVAAKAVAWWQSGSVAMLGALMDSGLDVLASAFNFLAVRHAVTPADAEHRFGHGKAEALAGLVQAGLVSVSAVFLTWESVSRLRHPEPVTGDILGIAVILFSIAMTLGLVAYQRRIVRLTASVAIRADNLHYVGDLLMNTAVIAALVMTAQFGLLWFDGVIGLAIAAIIAWSAISIIRGSYDQLMDREFNDADRARIRDIACAHRDVRAIHDLRTRRSGVATFIQFHLELDPDMRLSRAHEISDEVEAAVMAAFPGAEVMIHQDPAGLEVNPALAHT